MDDALIDGHAPAATEQDDCHDQTPEVEFLTVSKRIGLICGYPALTQPEQEKQFVTRIGRRVDTL